MGVTGPERFGSALRKLPRLRLRRAARIILLDPAGRVLLMRYDNGPPNGRHWSTPGGGLNAREDYPSAARRELAEETGWSASVSGSTWRALTCPAVRSRALMPCTPPTVSPPGAGGRWPNWTRPRNLSGLLSWPA